MAIRGPLAAAILAVLEHGPATVAHLSNVCGHLGRNRAHVRKTLDNLTNQGTLVRSSAYPVRYALPGDLSGDEEQREPAHIGRTPAATIVATALSSRSALERAWASL